MKENQFAVQTNIFYQHLKDRYFILRISVQALKNFTKLSFFKLKKKRFAVPTNGYRNGRHITLPSGEKKGN